MVDSKKGTPGPRSSADLKDEGEGTATRTAGATAGPETSVDRKNAPPDAPSTADTTAARQRAAREEGTTEGGGSKSAAVREGEQKQQQEDERMGVDHEQETARNKIEPPPVTSAGEPFQARRAPPSSAREGLVFFNRTRIAGNLRVMTEVKDPTSGEWGRGTVGELRQDDTMAINLAENERLVIERI